MSILHILQITNANQACIEDCLKCANHGDSFVIITDLSQNEIDPLLATFIERNSSCKTLIIHSEPGARSGKPDHIGYSELVHLSCEHSKTVSWF